MSTSKTNFVFGLTAMIFFGALIFLFTRNSFSTFHLEKNHWALKTDQNQLIVESPSAVEDTFISKLWPNEFRSISKIYLNEIDVGESLFLSNNTKAFRIDEALWAIDIENTRWLIFGEQFTKFPPHSSVSSKSDFWIINPKAQALPNLSPPTTAIFELSNRPSKKDLKDFSENNKTSLISTNKYDEIKIGWNQNDWKIQSISYPSKNN